MRRVFVIALAFAAICLSFGADAQYGPNNLCLTDGNHMVCPSKIITVIGCTVSGTAPYAVLTCSGSPPVTARYLGVGISLNGLGTGTCPTCILGAQ